MSAIRHARRASRPRLVIGLTLAMALSVLTLVGVRPAAAASPCGPPVVSVIACENTLPGDPPSDWQPPDAGDQTIQGFATSMSVNVGQTENFKIDTPATSYHIDILRIGWYGGDGARKVVSGMLPTATLPQTQPACVNDTQPTGLVDCGNWAVSASWAVPTTAVSGLYLAHLVRNDTGGSSLIPFVVRNDASHSDILFQTDDETWQAYNTWPGTSGNSLYQCSTNCPPGTSASYKGADAVSYNRPWYKTLSDPSWFMSVEYPMIRFLERNGYDMSYTSGVDMSQSGATSIIEQHKIYVTAGHDEYWSGQQRANVQAALNAGVNMAFFSGNEVFWKTRFAASIDGSNTPNRTLVTYKETHYNAVVDPQDPPTWTGSWMDPRFSPPGDGGQPQNALTGQLFAVDSGTTDITVPAYYSKLRFWRNTPVASLAPGQAATLDQGGDTLGNEWDVDADNGFRPAGEMDMSSTTVTTAQPFLDYGSVTTPGNTATVTHHLTLYRAPSGALVFGAGTIQWAWGLDDGNGTSPTDPAMQQAVVNLFADMGSVQPATLMSGLVSATQSTDTTPPTSTITSPSSGASFSDGSAVTISGTATDAGGVVSGVEVSTDGGTTWHPATTMSTPNTAVTWSYSWVAHGNPTTTIKSRAVDDSGNLEKPGPGLTVNVNCPCSIWGTNITPTTTDSRDSASVEVGVKFKSDTNGYITGIRFYKASTNTGTHIGDLWTSTGQLLASATFTNESASGWQQVNFSQPVAVSANTTYVASYFAPNGHYSDDGAYFYTVPQIMQPESTVNSAPLHALQNTNGVVNGVYTYSGVSAFPTSSNDASNYWVNPVFSPEVFNNAPGQVGTVSATAGYASANLTWAAPTSGDPVTTYTITPYIGSAAQTATTVTGNPAPTTDVVSGLTNGTTYTFTVTASNPAGAGPASAQSNAVTPTAPPTVTGVTPSSGATGVAVSAAPSATFSQAVTPSTVSFTVKVSGGNAVAGTVSFNSADTVATFTPSSSLAGSTTYTATVSGALSAPNSWSFTTAATCPCSIWNDGTPTGAAESNDPTAQTWGVRFQASGNGNITGVRFYKEPDDTGAHTGSLWSATGTLLASGTFSNETASGWQELDFSSPVAVTAGTTYVASFFSSTGYPAYTAAGLASAVTNGPLTALAGGGVYAKGSSNTFPTSTYNNNNYWVDVVYSPTSGSTAPAVTGVTPSSGATGVAVSAAPSATFSQAVTPSTVSFTVKDSGGNSVAGTVGFSGGNTVATFTPTNALAGSTRYTATVSGAQNASGTPMSGPYSWSFTTGAVGQCPCSIWQDGTPTGAAESNDPTAQTWGVRFQASGNGNITGVRFYKEPDDTGAHTGSLWSATGTLLASGTFSNETASGWQELDFSSPVAVTAGTTYVASFFSSTGFPAYTAAGLASAVTNGPLTALAGGGVYAKGSSNTFPTSTYNNNNYWVDVVYSPASGPTAPGAPTGVSATAGNGSAGVSWTAPGNGGSAITSYTVTPFIGSAAQTPVTVSGSPPATSATVTGLTNGTAYTFTVSATNGVGTGPASSPSGAVTPNAPPVVSAVSPASGSTGNAVSAAPSATFSQAVTPSTVSFTVKDSGGNSVPGTVGFSGGNTVATFTPTNSLAASTTYTATVSGAQNASGTPMSGPYSWSFTTGAVGQCPCSIWQDGTPTGSAESNDPNAQTSGVRFQASSSGNITGVRFYKEVDDIGAHTGSLWSATGTLLASGTFSNETASGWQELDFSSPVAVTAGTTYVASFFSSTGHPAYTAAGLASAVTNGPLTALAGGGVYAYGSSNTFPTSTYNNNNYWVDVVYSPAAGTTAPVVSAVSPASGSTGNAVSAAPSATFSQAVTPSTVSFTVKDSGGNSVAGSVGFNGADTVATFTPTNALAGSTTYTATVSGAQNASGTPMSGPYSWSFATGAVGQCPCSIWQDGTPTGAAESNDPNAQTSGVRFQASSSGNITGVRFYKEVDDIGAHTGSLWSATGTLLASGTFSNETASGWQELDFSSPVAVTAGTTYVASYFSSTGYPAYTAAGLASAVTNGPLTALAGGGVYAYGSSNTFPTNTYNNNNYWVDVVYSP